MILFETGRRSAVLAAALAAGLLVPALAAPAKKKTARRTRSAPKPRPETFSVAARARATEAVTDWISSDVPIENPAALVPFFEQLYRYERGEQPLATHTTDSPASQGDDSVPTAGPLRILHYGDSHTAADEWTGALRNLFQARFGAGGGGYSYAGRPWNSYRRLDLRSFGTRGWHSDGLVGRSGDGLYGLGGVSISTRSPRESVALEADCEHVEIFFLRQPGGGKLRLTADGEEVEIIRTDGELAPGYHSFRVPSGQHRFQLTTLNRAPVRLFGWVTENARGVTYETLGINGAQASIALKWDMDVLASNLNRRSPVLIVLAYGTNEAGNRDWEYENYHEMFVSLIGRFRAAAPASSILVVGPPDRMRRSGRQWEPLSRIDTIIEAQRAAALANGCAFWDLRARMGGKGSMADWVKAGLAQLDRVHFTGAGYRLLGDVFFRDVIGNYSAFVKVREEVIGKVNGQASSDR